MAFFKGSEGTPGSHDPLVENHWPATFVVKRSLNQGGLVVSLIRVSDILSQLKMEIFTFLKNYPHEHQWDGAAGWEAGNWKVVGEGKRTGAICEEVKCILTWLLNLEIALVLRGEGWETYPHFLPIQT